MVVWGVLNEYNRSVMGKLRGLCLGYRAEGLVLGCRVSGVGLGFRAMYRVWGWRFQV